jgi:dihydroneopterin aldolase
LPKLETLKVHINDFHFDTIIGILPFEKKTPQKVIIDIEFDYTYDVSAKNFIDYSEITALVQSSFHEQKFELIEEGLLFIKTLLYKTYPIDNLNLKITKPNILKNCSVAVSL